MVAIFNPLDVNKWRNVIAQFDQKRAQFYQMVAELQRPAPTPALEAKRKELLAKAGPLDRELQRIMNALKTVRDLIKGAGQSVGLGNANSAGDLGWLPIILVGIAGVAYVIGKVTDWLKDAEKYKLATAQIEAGWTPEQVQAVQDSGPKEQPKLFGMDMGALKWVAVIAGVAIAGPVIVREVQKRL